MSSQTKKHRNILQYLANISLLLYPIVAHVGILMDQVILPICYLMAAIYINSLKLLSRYRTIGAAITLLMCVLFYAVLSSESHALIIYLPPILIPCWLAFIFLGSLSTESALISRIAERIEGKKLDPRHLLYTRRLTALWGIAFLMMICEAIVLAIWVPFEIWSWWVHVGNYIIIATLFLVEIMVRYQFIGQRAQLVQLLKALLQKNWHDQ